MPGAAILLSQLTDLGYVQGLNIAWLSYTTFTMYSGSRGVIGPGTEWPTAMDYLIWSMVINISWALVFAVSPWQSSRHLMAKNEHVVLRASCLACLAAALL